MPVVDVPTDFTKFYTQLCDAITEAGKKKSEVQNKSWGNEEFKNKEENLRAKREKEKIESNSWEGIKKEFRSSWPDFPSVDDIFKDKKKKKKRFSSNDEKG